MTNYEIDKKKMNQEELLNDVAEKRSNLTMILLDLMEQQVVIIVIKKSIILFTLKKNINSRLYRKRGRVSCYKHFRIWKIRRRRTITGCYNIKN